MPTAFVTGASRGVGRGIAVALADAGFKVFATGRTIDRADLPPSVIRLTCDHLVDSDTGAAFERVAGDSGRLDVLVNSAWGGYERMVENGAFTWSVPFWEQPLHRWSSMMDAGVRAAYVCASHAARMMVPHKRGLIVNISFWAAQKYIGNVPYGVSKAATDKLTHDIARELRPHGIAALSLYPGLVRTESVLAAAKAGWLDLSNSESPEFSGRVIAALAADPRALERSGEVIVGAEAALAYGLTDVDGRQPVPLTLAKV
jgi:NAD(P)-dependent dehydrogenase (short-subunit alcohol dehydrogenase family)